MSSVPFLRPKEVYKQIFGVGRTSYYKRDGVRAHPSFPRRINIPGVGWVYLRRELEEFADLLATEARAAAAEHGQADERHPQG